VCKDSFIYQTVLGRYCFSNEAQCFRKVLINKRVYRNDAVISCSNVCWSPRVSLEGAKQL